MVLGSSTDCIDLSQKHITLMQCNAMLLLHDATSKCAVHTYLTRCDTTQHNVILLNFALKFFIFTKFSTNFFHILFQLLSHLLRLSQFTVYVSQIIVTYNPRVILFIYLFIF